MKRLAYLAYAVPVFLAVGVGCAESPEDELLYGIGTNEPADAGPEAEPEEGIKIPKSKPAPAKEEEDAAPPKDAGAPPPADAGGPKPDAGSSSSGGATSDPCATNTCANAVSLGQVSGDTQTGAAGIKTYQAATSKWFTLRVTEDYSSWLFGDYLYLRTTLTSPPGHNYDLFVYQPDNDVKECHAVRKSSESMTGTDKVSIKWGEGPDPNGEDDSRTVTIEVREVDGPGTCDPAAKWTLKVEGFAQ